jgi:hypothetical protein
VRKTSAREAYKPNVNRDRKASVSVSELFAYPKLDETFYAALKSAKNSNVLMSNIDQLEKVYRKQTDVVLDMDKLRFFLRDGKSRRSDKDSKALRTRSLLWAHLFREITGGGDLFGAEFVKELISQV